MSTMKKKMQVAFYSISSNQNFKIKKLLKLCGDSWMYLPILNSVD